MKKKIGKKFVLNLITAMPDSTDRRAVVEHMTKSGELSDADIAELIAAEMQRGSGEYADALRSDRFVQYLWKKYEDAPEYLARALVIARTDLFWNYALAFRAVLKLQADLGPVFIPPWRGAVEDEAPFPIPNVSELVAKDLRALDVEYKTRFFLYFYARDPLEAEKELQKMREASGIYDQSVLDEVSATFDRLLRMEFPGAVKSLRSKDRIFPALHVRWWLDQVREIPRVLNIGDTGTYKTSFGFVGLDHFGCRKVLVLCAANARENHRRECREYFTNGAERVQVLSSIRDLPAFLDGFASRQFHIVGWPSLVSADVVDTLEQLPFDAIFVDECQYGKAVIGKKPAKRAVAMLRLARIPTIQRVIACSATPWENRPEELAAVSTLIRPDLFDAPDKFARSGLIETPRILREIFARNVVDVELHEVSDLPDIRPKPWVDLFGAVRIDMMNDHALAYATLREDGGKQRIAAAKTTLLLKAAIHPALVRDAYDWDQEFRARLADWRTSSKLVWLREFLDEHLPAAKVVVGTGIFVSGITRAKDAETPWVGDLLEQWYGREAVLRLDGDVAIGKQRNAIIRQWREDPRARILLASMLACPDSINLTIPKQRGVEELWITALSCGWKPWKQFLGRFWREGQGVPVRYILPVIPGTIDDDLLRFNQDKWHVQRLFKARVPLTEEEWRFISAKPGSVKIRELARTPAENVHYIGLAMRGAGEAACAKRYGELYGATTQAEAYARSFLVDQDDHRRSASGNIACYQAKTIRAMLDAGMLASEQVFDAGCGPLTLERALGLPVYGRDMNQHMIEVGRQFSPHRGVHAEVGVLSSLPSDWTGKFLLTSASLVLDWTSRIANVHDVPERAHILRELIRVTHPQGHLWITFTDPTLDEDLAENWIKTFRDNGFAVIDAQSGYVLATDGPRDFGFWSIVASPNGRTLERVGADDLRFTFEVGRMTRRMIRRGKQLRRRGRDRSQYPHEHFEVVSLRGGRPLADHEAIDRSLKGEVLRWLGIHEQGRKVGRRVNISHDRWREIPWRTLVRLHELGKLGDLSL